MRVYLLGFVVCLAAAACVDGTTPDCSDANAQCGPGLDGSVGDATLGDGATDGATDGAGDAHADSSTDASDAANQPDTGHDAGTDATDAGVTDADAGVG